MDLAEQLTLTGNKIKKLITRFHTDLLLVEGLSVRTADTYRICIEIFIDWCVQKKIELSEISTSNLVYYLAWRKTNNCTALTVAKDISALRALGSYLVRMGIWKENFSLLLDHPKLGKSLPRVLSLEQIERLFSVLDTSSPLGVRDDALFELIYSCGLRISEAAALLIDNVHLDEKILMVQGKGKKERIIPFGNKAKEKLILYLEKARPVLTKQKIIPEVFVNYRGNPISRKGIWKRFKELESLSGVKSKVHTLRHSFATHLLSGGADLRAVQELLGHADLAATQIYTHVDDKQLSAYHEKYFPGHRNK